MDRINLTTQGQISGYLIKGITHRQKVFRPGDWGERLMGVITLFVGERRPGLHIASTRLAMPIVSGGIKCLFVSDELRSICPDAFEFVMRFAADNELPVDEQTAPLFSVSPSLARAQA
ncbi:DUF3579 domain-containing protein [Burkholderia guangdongensis]|uniref:DUF3579 domain-containing protein n=1 Tax=Burkholderia guangdongensis TaxID=1792500 RepID=UPI0015C768F2|nr:DUF3579 domain-containing protein [Burkholderia guangdongensis]